MIVDGRYISIRNQFDRSMSLLKTDKMVYRHFGNSGLKVSAISFGNMVNYLPENAEVDEQLIRKCLEYGINHFDTAEVYGAGQAEISLGKIFTKIGVAREDIVVATKIHSGAEPDLNNFFSTNKKHVKESLQKSLARLGMEYVDILYAHFYDAHTPLEEICRAFHDVIEDGKAFYWATSNWNAESVFEAFQICERLNLHKPIGAQNEYNMLERYENESEYESLYKKYNYGLIAWSPLAGGFLTGKHFNGEAQGSRFTSQQSNFPIEVIKGLFYSPYANQKTIGALKQVQQIADQLGCKLLNLAVAWVIKYPHTSSALIGARSIQQLDEIVSSMAIIEKITPEVEGRINKILANHPAIRTNWLTWQPSTAIRPLAK